jgi:hypothetical protein
MFAKRIAASVLAVLALAVPAIGKNSTAFNKLLDTSYVAPDGQVVFTIDRPQMGSKTVAFIAATSTPNEYLLAVPSAGGAPVVLVSNSTKVPGGDGKFTGSLLGYFTIFEPPGCSSPAVGNKYVAFVGRDASGGEGVYSVPVGGGKVTKLVNYGTAIPGGPVQSYTNFNVNYSPCNVSISGDTVVFDAGGSGIYQVDVSGKNLTRIADFNTPATFKTFQVQQYEQPTISGSNISYIGSTVFGPYAVFDGTPPADHALVHAKRNSFDGLAYPVISGTEIDFLAHLDFPNEGIYRAEVGGNKPVKIMDFNTKLPKGTPGTSFNAVGSSSNGQNWSPAGALDVFAAQTTDGTSNYAGLFSSCNAGRLRKILTQGDTLGGVTDVFPGAGVSNLIAQKDGSYMAAILVGGFRYAAIYTIDVPGC